MMQMVSHVRLAVYIKMYAWLVYAVIAPTTTTVNNGWSGFDFVIVHVRKVRFIYTIISVYSRCKREGRREVT